MDSAYDKDEFLGSDDSGLVDNDDEFAELEREFEVFEMSHGKTLQNEEGETLEFVDDNLAKSFAKSSFSIGNDNEATSKENFTLKLEDLDGMSDHFGSSNLTAELKHALPGANMPAKESESGERLVQLQAECTELQQMLQTANFNAKGLKEEEDRLVARIKKLEAENAKLLKGSESAKEVENTLRQEKEQEMRVFRRQLLEEKNRQLEDLSSQLLKSQSAREKHLESSVMRLEKLLTESQQRHSFLERKIDLLGDQLQQSSLEKEKQIEKIAELQRERIDLQGQLDRIETANDTNGAREDESTARSDELVRKVESLERERQELVEKSNEESLAFQQVAKLFVTRLVSLKTGFEELVENVLYSSDNFQRKLDRIPGLVDALINLKSQMAENDFSKTLLAQIDDLGRVNEELETAKLIIESEKQSLERKLDELQNGNEQFREELRQKANDAFVAALKKIKDHVQQEREQLSERYAGELRRFETAHQKALKRQHEADLAQFHEERMSWSAKESSLISASNRNREKYLTTLRKMRDDLNLFKTRCLQRMEQEWKKRKLKLETAHVQSTLDLKREHAKEIAILLSSSSAKASVR